MLRQPSGDTRIALVTPGEDTLAASGDESRVITCDHAPVTPGNGYLAISGGGALPIPSDALRGSHTMRVQGFKAPVLRRSQVTLVLKPQLILR